MPLAAGARLGPYEILSSLGAGGMGEVYRARDPRLGRDVAVKIISGDVSASPERLRRFEREARAVAALEHPGILAVHDVGTHEGRAYVVFELLEGETLRERLSRGAIPVRKALELGGRIAEALAAAHARGVVHRDLKPENVFLVREGHVKLLDFGLAQLTQAIDDGSGEPATRTETDRGAWVGTPGYVSPEQLRGQAADARSDIFALGAVLYEMLSGKRAFHGSTPADTLSAILDRDPPPMTGGPAPPALEKVVRRCLEKDPADRFQSARDVAFALEALSIGSMSETGAPLATAKAPRRSWRPAAVLVGVAALASVTFMAGRRSADKPPPVFKQLTFRRGWLDNARFAPDGRTVVYGAGWEGKPVELFQTRTDSPGSRPLGLPHAKVLSISPQGQMAVLLDPARQRGYFRLGTLVVVPLAGGTPRELLEDVYAADWTPDGSELCIARMQPGGEIRIELPPGTVLDWAPPMRRAALLHVSRGGRYVTYCDAGAGRIMLLDRESRLAKELVVPAPFSWGLAWAPKSREVWYTNGIEPGARDVNAVDLEGRRRLVYRSSGNLSLLDTTDDGRALFHRSLDRYGVMELLPGSGAEQEVTVYDNSLVGALSADGRRLLLNTPGGGAGPGWSTYLRQDGGDPVRVAAGAGSDLSPDGRSALVNDGGKLEAVPIGPGLPQRIDLGGLQAQRAAFLPSTPGAVIVEGRERPADPPRLWVVRPDASRPRALDTAVTGDWAVAPDGGHVAVRIAADTISIVPIAGGSSRSVRVADTNLTVSRWSGDGRALFLARTGGWPCEIHRLDLATEKVEFWKQAAPPDPTGMAVCNDIRPSADGRSYVYVANRSLASLVVAEGLR
jgi:hypothetical protein